MSIQKINYHFALIKSKANSKGLIPIYLRISINSKRINISTTHFIKEVDWVNFENTYTTSKRINKDLNKLIMRLKNICNELLINEEEITLVELKNRLTWKEDVKVKNSIISSFEIHNNEMKKLIGYKFSHGTYKNYKTTLKYLKEFIPLKYKTDDLPLEKLNFEFLKNYEFFLVNTKNCTNNGVMKQVQRIKKVVHLAVDNEWIEKDNTTRFKLKYNKSDRGYLTESELQKIEDAKLTNSLANVRDYFLFSCYTGISYVDIKALCYEHIQQDDKENDWIIQNRGKTNIQAMIPLLPKAKTILKKYLTDEKNTGNIFKVISNQKTNSFLKDIATIAKINKRISFHLARHTFATTITLSKGIPIETVSKMLGHNKISTTQIYSRVLKSKILNDMKNLF